MEKELEDELVFLRKVVNSLPGHIYWKDKDGVYLGCNEEQAKALNLDRSEYIKGKTDFDLPWADQAKSLQMIDQEVMNSRKKIRKEEKVSFPGISDDRVFLSEKMPLYADNGDVKGILGISLDITELKETQKKMQEALDFAKEAERKRKRFLSNQEHDINTALTGIIYAGRFLSMVLSDAGLDEHLEMSDMTSRCGMRLQAYNQSLLQGLCWLDDEGQIIERRTEIRGVLGKLYDINFLAAKAKGTTLLIPEISDNIPKYLRVDDIALFQCLQDLVGNAISFTKDGEITVNVRLPESSEADLPAIAFHVRDTGRGIKDEHQRYIFEDFYKVLPSNVPDLEMGVDADEDKGRGLGLAVSRKKAESMGGELHLEWSREGEGSEFVLTLPLKPALNQG